MTKLVAIHGAIGSGKDTTADALVKLLGWKKIEIKSTIVDVLSLIFSIPRSEFENRETKEIKRTELYNKSPRELMRSLGTEWGIDKVNECIWIDQAIDKIKSTKMMGYPGIVVPDLRFSHEFNKLKPLGFEMWKIKRPNNPYEHATSNHRSDILLPDSMFDSIVYNVGTIGSLINHVKSKIEQQ